MDVPDPKVSTGSADRIRKAFGMSTSQEKSDTELIAKVDRLFTYAQKARNKTEYEWWLNDQFYQGEQYVSYNRVSAQVQRSSTKNDNKIVINKIKQNARFVVMWLNRDHPQMHVLPGVQEDSAYLRAKAEEHYLQHLYEHLELNNKNKQTTLDGYKYKVGFQKILWDKDALAPTSPWNNGGTMSGSTKGEVMIERVDPFEIYMDPYAYDIESARFICHALPRTLGELRANPLYMNQDKLSADNKVAASMLKESQIRQQTAGSMQFAPAGDDDLSTVIVREMFWRELDPETKKFFIRLVTTTATGVLLRDQKWPLDFYPFEMFLADPQGMPLDGGSPIRDLRSPQRALNQFNSIVQENGRLMAKIVYSSPRGANIGVITDEVAQIMEYDPTPGGRPEQLTPAGLPAYVGQHLDRLEKYIDDIGGNHSASYGRSPGSKASGELVNKLQEGDSNNLLLMRDQLTDFQKRVMKKALLTFKYNGTVDRAIRSKDTNAIGLYDFVILKPNEVSTEDDLKIIVGNGLPYTQQDRQELFLNMKKEGIIDNAAFLKAVNIPDLDIVAKSQALDIQRALKENAALMAGETILDPNVAEDHSAHLETHTQLIKSEMFHNAPQLVQDVVMDHFSKHVQLSIFLQKRANSTNVEPIRRSLSMMIRPNNPNEFTPIERTNALGLAGIESDAAQIQVRGGLNIQDPASAEQQAHVEDMQLWDDMPVPIGLSDNHQVHIETHSQVMQTPAWDTFPAATQKVVNDHIHAHLLALKSQQMSPGLQPGANTAEAHRSTMVKTNKAAMNPQDPTKRPLMPHEHIQHKGAVQNQLASESMMQRQAEEEKKQKEATQTTTTKSKSKAKP